MKPLEGMRVLDLGRLIPGGLVTRKLADLGADVVKIEDPQGGDYLRVIPPLVDGVSVMHALLNRGKRSVSLDLRTEAGRETLEAMAATADVVVEVSVPGRLQSLGVDISRLREINPRLVVCSVTGFGQNGQLATLRSHGLNMDALAGVAAVHHGDRPRLADGLFSSVAVELGGLNGAIAVLAAYLHSRATGVGSWIDISCWDSAVEANRVAVAYRIATGEDLMKISDVGAIYNLYEARDGRLVLLAAIERKFWETFCHGVDRPDLLDRWGGDSPTVDYGSDPSLYRELAAIFRTADADEWLDRFLAWGIPGSPVLGVEDVIAHPHLEARGLISEFDEPTRVPNILDAIRWADEDSRPGEKASYAPAIGQHTNEVLAEWLTAPRGTA